MSDVSLQIALLVTDRAKPDGNNVERFEVERLIIHLQIKVKYKKKSIVSKSVIIDIAC